MDTLSTGHADWLAETRKLDVEIAAKMGLYSRGPMVGFPYVKDGKRLFDKMRDPLVKSNMAIVKQEAEKVEQTFCWNEDALSAECPSPQDVLVITEGELDALAVMSAGYKFVVSVPSGAANSDKGAYSKALNCLAVNDGKGGHVVKPCIDQFSRIVLAVDCDHDGLCLRRAIVALLGEDKCCLPTFPIDCKDPNSVLENGHGFDALREMIDEATPTFDDGFIDAVTLARITPKAVSIKTGIKFIDQYLRFGRPEFMVCAGSPGSGKSTAMQFILFSAMMENPNLRLTMFNAEGHEALPNRRAAAFWNARNPSIINAEAIEPRTAWIEKHVGVMQPRQDEDPTLKWLLRSIEHQAVHRKRNVFMIDPWNEIVVPRNPNQSRTDDIGDACIALKNLGKRHGLIIIVVHHIAPRRDRRFMDEPPIFDDIADSSNFARKADHIMLAWRPRKGKKFAKLIFDKSKDHSTLGVEGNTWVYLNEQNFELTQLDHDPLKREAEVKAAAKADKHRAKSDGGDKFKVKANGVEFDTVSYGQPAEDTDF